jgi:hypothetical protein
VNAWKNSQSFLVFRYYFLFDFRLFVYLGR